MRAPYLSPALLLVISAAGVACGGPAPGTGTGGASASSSASGGVTSTGGASTATASTGSTTTATSSTGSTVGTGGATAGSGGASASTGGGATAGSGGGSVASTTTATTGSTSSASSAASTGSGGATAGTGGSGGAGPVVGTADVTAPTGIPLTTYHATDSAVGFGTDDALVAWVDSRPLDMNADLYAPALYATRIRKSDGALLDPANILVASNDILADKDFFDLHVVSDGKDFLVAYDNGVACVGYRVRGSDGAVLDATDFYVAPACGDIEFDGTHYWAMTGGAQIQANLIDPATGTSTSVVVATSSKGTGAQQDGGAVVAFGNGQALVTWTDGRYAAANQYDVYAARVKLDGTVLDPNGFVVCDDPNSQREAFTVFDGTSFVVTWADGRGPDLYAARVDPTTKAVSPANGAPITGLAAASVRAFVTEGANFTALGYTSPTPSTTQPTYARVRQSDLTVLDNPPAALELAVSADPATVAIGGDGTARLFVYGLGTAGSGVGLYGTLTSPAPAALGAPDRVLTTRAPSQLSAGSAFDGTQYLAAWYEEYADGTFGIRANLLDGAGVPKTAGGIVLPGTVAKTQPDQLTTLDYPRSLLQPPAVGAAGGVFVVAWQATTPTGVELLAARVDATGALLDTTPVTLLSNPTVDSTDGLSPAIACGAGSCLLVWSEIPSAVYKQDVNGVVITPSAGGLAVGATIPIAHAGGNQSLPVVASDGSDYLVAWRDDKLGGTDVFAARVSGAGAVIDTSSFMVFDAMGAVSDGPQPPAAAFDGTSYVVAWPSISNAQPTFGRVKPADASLLDGNGKTIKTLGGGPLALTRSATYTGLVFGYTTASNLAVRIDGTGNVLDAQPVPVPAGSFSLPAASKAGVLMTTWQVYPTPPYDAFRGKANQVGL